jgi:predicted transcriptional regulator of viral defense system
LDVTKVERNPLDRARSVFKEHGGMLRMSAAVDAGIHRDTLRKMVASGDLQKISRGLYQMVELTPPPHPDLAALAAKVPGGVICLISALSFHNLTTQIPHEVYLAIARNSEPPRIGYPPVRIYRFSGKTFTEGIEEHASGPFQVRIYSREKTIADCFKFRNKLGLDTVLEAVRLYRQSRRINVDALLHCAEICRVAKVMRPYLEAML